MPGTRIAAARYDQPMNLIPAYLSAVPGRVLVDTGSTCSILSGEMYQRILRKGTRMRQLPMRRRVRMTSADKSPMEVKATVEIDVKNRGRKLPVCIFGDREPWF